MVGFPSWESKFSNHHFGCMFLLGCQILLLFFVCFVIGGIDNYPFTSSYDIGSETNVFDTIQSTSDGGYIAAGKANDPSTNYDISVVKFSPFQEIEWLQIIGGSGSTNDYVNSIKQTFDGGYILVGTTFSFGMGLEEIVTAKLSSNGSLSWIRTLGRSDTDMGNDVIQHNDSSYIIVGQTEFGASSDILLAKYSENGTIQWQKSFDGPDGKEDVGNGIEKTDDGGFIVTGKTTRSSFLDGFVAKFHMNGSTEWIRSYGGATGEDSIAIRQLTDGGYVFIGGGIRVTRLHRNGSLFWCKAISDGTIAPLDIVGTTDGNFVVTGSKFNLGKFDGMVFKMDSITGVIIWAKYITGSSDNIPHSVTLQEETNRILISGEYETNDALISRFDESDGTTCETWTNWTGYSIADQGGSYNMYELTERFVISELNETFPSPTLKSSPIITEKKICNCLSGYYGDICNITTCFGKWNNDSSVNPVCSGYGNCDSLDSCQCVSSYFGEHCNITTCNGIWNNDSANICNQNKGECFPKDICQCTEKEKYSGEFCEIPKCPPYWSNDSARVCSNHGNCTEYDVCVCDSSLYELADDCSVWKCFGVLSNLSNLVCSGSVKGYCKDVDSCECNSNYYGEACNITTCFSVFSNISSSCGDHGNCINNDVCYCQQNWFGDECNITICHDIFSNETSTLVCGGHGTCWNSDRCDCQEGYFGTECRNTTCFGKWNNETGVCGDKGKCIEKDECECFSNYYGVYCNTTKCSDIMSNQTNKVCNNHGTCYDYNKCDCQESYFGINCTITICNGIFSNQSSSCGDHGTCISKEICDCDDNYWFGDEEKKCDITTCSGNYSNTTTVCSEQGNCTSYDQCTCNPGILGSQCQELLMKTEYFFTTREWMTIEYIVLRTVLSEKFNDSSLCNTTLLISNSDELFGFGISPECRWIISDEERRYASGTMSDGFKIRLDESYPIMDSGIHFVILKSLSDPSSTINITVTGFLVPGNNNGPFTDDDDDDGTLGELVGGIVGGVSAILFFLVFIAAFIFCCVFFLVIISLLLIIIGIQIIVLIQRGKPIQNDHPKKEKKFDIEMEEDIDDFDDSHQDNNEDSSPEEEEEEDNDVSSLGQQPNNNNDFDEENEVMRNSSSSDDGFDEDPLEVKSKKKRKKKKRSSLEDVVLEEKKKKKKKKRKKKKREEKKRKKKKKKKKTFE